MSRPRPWIDPTAIEGFEPDWAGQFDTFDAWVSHAERALTGEVGTMNEPLAPICVDAKGRRCNIGKDFNLARDDGAFPVRYFWRFRPAATEAGRRFDRDNRTLEIAR